MIETCSQLAIGDTSLFLTHWTPEATAPTAVMVIAHGMAEHGGRYREFAERLTAIGLSVYATDHRGHGRSVPEGDTLGHFGDEGGWELALSDLDALIAHAAQDHPGLPVFLFGHSMGSFLVRDLIPRTAQPLSGVILSGTADIPSLLAKTGWLLAGIQARFSGARTPSWLMDRLSFGTYNLCFFPARTPFDWLCSDPLSVDRYIDDPLCGYISTATLFKEINGCLGRIGKRSHIDKTPKGLPLLFLAGKKDPVATMGTAASRLAERYRTAGVRDTSAILYDGARHELFGEPLRETVYRDITEWVTARLS